MIDINRRKLRARSIVLQSLEVISETQRQTDTNASCHPVVPHFKQKAKICTTCGVRKTFKTTLTAFIAVLHLCMGYYIYLWGRDGRVVSFTGLIERPKGRGFEFRCC